MIYVETIPPGCVCGWLRTNSDPAPEGWRLIRPDVACRWSDHHEQPGWTQDRLDDLDDWVIDR